MKGRSNVEKKKSKVSARNKPRPKAKWKKSYTPRNPSLPSKSSKLLNLKGTRPQRIFPNIQVLFLREWTIFGGPDRWRPAILVDENVTTREWNAAGSAVRVVVAGLVRLQGSNPQKFALSLMADFEEWKRTSRRFGYGMMAKDQNFNASCLAMLAYDPASKTEERRFGEMYLIALLQAFGYKANALQAYLAEARERAAERALVWTPDVGPFDAARVRRALIKHQRGLKSRDLVYGEQPYARLAQAIDDWLEAQGHWEKVRRRYKRQDPGGYAEYQKRLEERTERIQELTLLRM